MSTTTMNLLNCDCQKQCVVFTCKKGDNQGRKFYRCPQNRLPIDCQFLRWCDEVDDVWSQKNESKKSSSDRRKLQNVEGDAVSSRENASNQNKCC